MFSVPCIENVRIVGESSSIQMLPVPGVADVGVVGVFASIDVDLSGAFCSEDCREGRYDKQQGDYETFPLYAVLINREKQREHKHHHHAHDDLERKTYLEVVLEGVLTCIHHECIRRSREWRSETHAGRH